MKIIEIIQEIKKLDPEKKGLTKLRKNELQEILTDLKFKENLISGKDEKEEIKEEKENFSYEIRESKRESFEKDFIKDSLNWSTEKEINWQEINIDSLDYGQSYQSKIDMRLEKYRDFSKNRIKEGKADFKGFLENLKEKGFLESFPSSSDFIKSQYRKVLASILSDYRKEVLKTYESTFRYRIGKNFFSEKKYIGKSRFLPLTFTYNTSKNFPSYWLGIINQWDSSEEKFLESEESFSSHLQYLNSSLKTSLFNESMDFNFLSVPSTEVKEKEKEKRKESIIRKFPFMDSRNNLIGFSCFEVLEGKITSTYFLSN